MAFKIAIWNRIDPEPFRRWCDEQPESDGLLALRLGIGSRRLHRWRQEAPHLDRLEVAEALFKADVLIETVYGPESDEDLERAAIASELHCDKLAA